MAESKRFLLRLDPRLFEALRRWAQDDLRSVNAQIDYLLTDQVRRGGRLPHQPRRRAADAQDLPRDEEDDSVDSDEGATSATADALPSVLRGATVKAADHRAVL